MTLPKSGRDQSDNWQYQCSRAFQATLYVCVHMKTLTKTYVIFTSNLLYKIYGLWCNKIYIPYIHWYSYEILYWCPQTFPFHVWRSSSWDYGWVMWCHSRLEDNTENWLSTQALVHHCIIALLQVVHVYIVFTYQSIHVGHFITNNCVMKLRLNLFVQITRGHPTAP